MAAQPPTRQRTYGPKAMWFLSLPLDIRDVIHGSVLLTPPKAQQAPRRPLQLCLGQHTGRSTVRRRMSFWTGYVFTSDGVVGSCLDVGLRLRPEYRRLLRHVVFYNPGGSYEGNWQPISGLAKPASEPRNRDLAWRLLTSCAGLRTLERGVWSGAVGHLYRVARGGKDDHILRRSPASGQLGDNIYAAVSLPVPLELMLIPEDIKVFDQAYRNSFLRDVSTPCADQVKQGLAKSPGIGELDLEDPARLGKGRRVYRRAAE
ncbi:hypothetical protein DL766_005013 [Monosporascus sp. MC13-8B]|nr:hypothetical protein DL763_004083 [Monosporascus cannonballus]RYP30185.1 hypothetical protein DL766_005013 [Monosporascus sp. MC13-8B]